MGGHSNGGRRDFHLDKFASGFLFGLRMDPMAIVYFDSPTDSYRVEEEISSLSDDVICWHQVRGQQSS